MAAALSGQPGASQTYLGAPAARDPPSATLVDTSQTSVPADNQSQILAEKERLFIGDILADGDSDSESDESAGQEGQGEEEERNE